LPLRAPVTEVVRAPQEERRGDREARRAS